MLSRICLFGALVLPSFGDAAFANSCSQQDRLLQCSVDGGALELVVCNEDARFSTTIGAQGEAPVLSINEPLGKVYYEIDANTGDHQLSLYTGSGVLELNATHPASIVFHSNSEAPIDYTCDPGSSEPQDPVERFNALVPVLSDGIGRLTSCRASEAYRQDPTACLNVYTRGCAVALATGGASCKEKERDVWNRLVAEALQNAIMTNNNDAFTSQLLLAQRAWEISRAQDCILAGPILFDQYLTDDGIKDCEASYAARRLWLLETLSK